MKGSTSTSVSPNHLAFVGGNGWHFGTAHWPEGEQFLTSEALQCHRK